MDSIIDQRSNHKAATIYRFGALDYVYVCCHCTTWFKTISEILDHIETHFDDDNDILQDDFEFNNSEPTEPTVNVVDAESFEPETHNENQDRMGQTTDASDPTTVTDLCFKSELCERTYAAEDDLSLHMKEHGNSVEHRCKLCLHLHSTAANLLTHLIELHLNAKKLACLTCLESFACKAKFESHLLEHIVRKDITYVTLMDDILSKCENGEEICVMLEVEECLPDKFNSQLQCDICQSNFDTKTALSVHMKDVHVPERATVKRGMYMCDKCNQNIQGKFLFYAHQYEHLAGGGGGNRTDAINDVTLLDNLKQFLETNIQFDELAPETPYGCKICCHLSVKRRKNIETHILQEHVYRLKCKKRSEKRYPCEYCGQKFTLSHNMIVHKRIHTLERPYTCLICNKSFSHSSYMKYHEKVHSGIRTHQCATCGLSFKSNTKLNMHSKVHSTETTKCPICDKEFKPHRLNVHIKHVHQNEHRPYKCTVCLQAFKTSKTLKTHSYRHSGEKKYKCRFHCNERFTSTAGRRGHERSKHETH